MKKVSSSKKTIDAVKAHIIAKGITQQFIADKTGLEKGSISRFLLAKHSPTLENFSLICDAAGLRVIIQEKKK